MILGGTRAVADWFSCGRQFWCERCCSLVISQSLPRTNRIIFKESRTCWIHSDQKSRSQALKTCSPKLTSVEAGSYHGVRRSRRRRHFSQAVPANRPRASTSDHDRPTACHRGRPAGWALSASGGSGGVQAPGDASPPWPCPWASALADRAAPDLHREVGGVWLCHSNHKRLIGREPSHPVGESTRGSPKRVRLTRGNRCRLALLSCRSTAAP